MLLEDDTRLVKIFLHITPEEQMHRFRARLTDPLKRWKLSYEDFRNRGHWKDYEAAIEDMVETTSSKRAPWHLVPANDKPFGRLAAFRIIAGRPSQPIAVEVVGKGDALRRYRDDDQAPRGWGMGSGSAELHQQFLAAERHH